MLPVSRGADLEQTKKDQLDPIVFEIELVVFLGLYSLASGSDGDDVSAARAPGQRFATV